MEGMSSSIALTLWAFLGMESAAQNSDAVENPKKNVPLACMFGTLGAAVIYILSTTVIQGIVPNAELAKSTGPFALAYAQMFNPTVGSIIMGLAVLACLGSLLGWQFTIAQTAKTAAADRLFPQIFAKVNRMDAPVAGMIVMGIVQTVMALSTISPSLSEQFGALVSLAVVTNVIPYIISLSALMVMMKTAGVTDGVYKRNTAIAVVAMLFSTFAIYASGKDAVLGGTIVLALTYILFGFLAPRFSGKSATARGAGGTAAAAAIAVVLAASFFPAGPAEAQTLDSVKKTGKIRLGYIADARPFSYEDGGKAAGYTVALCEKVAEQVKASAEWVPVTLENRYAALRDGKVDLLCGAEAETLARRKEAAFSIPVFHGGLGALLRTDAPTGLQRALSQGPAQGPIWRGTPTQRLLQEQTVAVVSGTAGEKALIRRLDQLQLTTKVLPVTDYAAGVQAVLERKASVFFADRSLLVDTIRRNPEARALMLVERRFSDVGLALALRRGDEDFRLAVDETLSDLYLSGAFPKLYEKWFGKGDAGALDLLRFGALPK